MSALCINIQSINQSVSFFIERHWQTQWRYIQQQRKCQKFSKYQCTTRGRGNYFARSWI